MTSVSDQKSARAPKIRMADVHKAFGSKRVLNGFSLDVAPGESVVIIGGSGTGKSVSLKCILGLLRPDRGTIEVDGQDAISRRGKERDHMLKKFGMLFQGAALFDSLPVWENVAFELLQTKALNRTQSYELAVEKLAQVGLSEDVAMLSPAELSGGMQKRVGLARAIAGDPEIIFFDEPTTGLDPITADVINDLIVKCVKELGATTLSITHDMASATKIADRIAMLYKGQIIWHGAANTVYNSGNDYVDQFVHGRAEGPITMELRR
jgi:phospholipid/cholesterol/gamma-HCH transport system ATP-binding protein